MTLRLARLLTSVTTCIALAHVAACGMPVEKHPDEPPAAPKNDAAVADQVNEAPAEGSASEVFLCGGETTRSAVDRYFADLAKALAEPGEDRLFDRLVSPNVTIRHEFGTVHRLDPARSRAVTPDFITREEWEKINSRGPDQLRDAGWRGCFLDQGKVWFEASEQDGLRLKSISREVPWDGPASN